MEVLEEQPSQTFGWLRAVVHAALRVGHGSRKDRIIGMGLECRESVLATILEFDGRLPEVSLP